MNKLLVMSAILVAALLSGCNTWHGFGKDLEHAGEKIQKSPNN